MIFNFQSRITWKNTLQQFMKRWNLSKIERLGSWPKVSHISTTSNYSGSQSLSSIWEIQFSIFFLNFLRQFFQFSSKISKKKKILRQKSKEFQRFLPPKPEMKAFIVFLSDNFFQISSQISNFCSKILRISKDFTTQTGSATADKAFIVFLCDNFFKFQAK